MEKPTKEEMAAEGIERIEQFTCCGCVSEKTCPFAWDFYNTCGACLAEK